MKPLLLLVLGAFSLAAQTPRAQAHAFFGLDSPPGTDFGYSSVGGGVDVFVYKGLAFSPSGGYLFSRDEGGGIGVFTLNGSYYFLRGKSKIEPFVTVGYGSLANFGDSVSTFDYGGGANFWFHKRVGFRAEVLNFQNNSYRELTSIRFGISFR